MSVSVAGLALPIAVATPIVKPNFDNSNFAFVHPIAKVKTYKLHDVPDKLLFKVHSDVGPDKELADDGHILGLLGIDDQVGDKT
jgi:hypothetical protein